MATINTQPHQEFLENFKDKRKPLVKVLLKAIKEAEGGLRETIKWNAPTFCDGDKDRMTIMLHEKDRVGLILHTGAKPKENKKAPPIFEDNTGLLGWNSNIRATIVFMDLANFSAKKSLFKRAVKRWIKETKNF